MLLRYQVTRVHAQTPSKPAGLQTVSTSFYVANQMSLLVALDAQECACRRRLDVLLILASRALRATTNDDNFFAFDLIAAIGEFFLGHEATFA